MELGPIQSQESLSTRSRAHTEDFKNSVPVRITRLSPQGEQKGKESGKETQQRDQSAFGHPHSLDGNLAK